MSTFYDVWVITAEDVYGKRHATGIAKTEVDAYKIAQEAIDALHLSISVGASKAQIEAVEKMFDTIQIQRARVEVFDD